MKMSEESPAMPTGLDSMSVSDVMQNYKPLYPHSGLWEDTFQMIKEDPIDCNIVQDLLSDLERNGEFREPIVLTTYEEYLEAEAEYKYAEGNTTDPYVPHVSNGTHRVYAHYLSQNKEVKVQFGRNPEGLPENDEDYPILASKVVVPPELDAEQIYALFDHFRSFKLNDDVWVNSELVSTHYNNFHILWAFGTKDVEALVPHMELINNKTLSIIENMQLIGNTKIGIINSEEEDDAFFDRESAKL